MDKARTEKCLQKCERFEQFQFERNGYFCYDRDSTSEKAVFNLTIGRTNSDQPKQLKYWYVKHKLTILLVLAIFDESASI